MIKRYYFGNWKMYQTQSSIKNFLKELKADKDWLTGLKNRSIGIAASYEHLYFLQQKIKEDALFIGAQDCSQCMQGAYTGQVSVQSLAEMKISFCIVGHSEARLYLGQSHEQVALKFKALLAANISPIFCIGETLVQKEQGLTLQVLFDQLEGILEFLQLYQGSTKIFIAYEPIYAIGTGVIPTIEDLHDIFSFLQNLREQVAVAKNLLLLYGGSVSSKTIGEFLKIDGISGFLIGKASIDFQELKKIVESE